MAKIGIALAGGGARGAYQIGAWKALREFGYDKMISVYSGASVGSLNAVLFAMGDYELAEKTWLSLDKDSLFNIDKSIYKRVIKEKLEFFNKGVYNTSNLEVIMDTVLDYNLIKQKEVYVATTYLGEKRSHFYDLVKTNFDHFFSKDKNMIKYQKLSELSEEHIRKSMLASCAIPVAFQPVTINQDTFYDGGLLDNTPIKPLEDAECDKILVIDLFRMNFKRFIDQEKENVYYLHPKKSLRGILDFDSNKIRRRFELGYVDMCAFLEKNPDLFKEN